MNNNLRNLFLCIFVFFITNLFSQDGEGCKYDKFRDTLIVFNNQVINCEKIYIEREKFIEADTLLINQKGLVIDKFNIQAIALGQNIILSSNSNKILKSMKDLVTNQSTKYKFIYIKDIILRTTDGRLVSPSVNNIKIVFIN